MAGFLLRRLAALLLLSLAVAAPAAAETADFPVWLEALRADARTQGIGEATIAAALTDLQPIDRVIELDHRQPEVLLTYKSYLARVVTPQRVANGRAQAAANHALLARVAARYKVPARFVVALWGVETDYGKVTGGFPVIAALATLAWEGRRAQYFRTELLNALRIVDQGHIRPEEMIGSWAGAMGQCQFMPSSFLKFAQDFDGDGRRDIWKSLPDVLASAANYLASEGWDERWGWGRAVRLPAHFDHAQLGLDKKKTVAEWKALGIRRPDGGPLPDAPIAASVILADKTAGPAFMVYDNFRIIMKWNRSTNFALAVGSLADRIGNR